ncbi:TetR/AcrR family transcriptional regulator [Kitasatospora sp. NPDC059571]|uniref:TetR/AcrR family transcriptional regulator n=1 Tax=Kitasatospora sp. NPDC059571 TaxID=3346871 RepID=UPI00369BD3AA
MAGTAGQGAARAADGRTERGRQTREKIADALLSLLDDGEPIFPADRVAERAGVSRRLVFHHFQDMAQLIDTAIARRMGELSARIGPLPTEGPRSTRVAALTAQRARILEWITPARLAVLRMDAPSEQVRQAVDQVSDFARRRLGEVFATEFDPLPEDRRTDLLNALDAVTTWGAWHHWRTRGLEPEDARRTMATAVHALLAAAAGPEPAGDGRTGADGAAPHTGHP